jgi:hypothetical protein
MKKNYSKIIALLILLTSSSFLLAVPLSGTYTVGSGETYTTPLDAMNAARNEGISGDVVFNIKAGTYNAYHRFYSINSNYTITFQSLSGNKNDVTLANSSNNYVLYMYSIDNITFKNLTIRQNSSNRAVRFGGNMKNITFDNCDFHGYNSTSSTTSYSIIYNTSGNNENFVYQNCLFDNGSRAFYSYGQCKNMTVKNCTSRNQYLAYYLQSKENLIFEGNVVELTTGNALEFYNNTNVTIKNNKITSNSYSLIINNTRISSGGRNLIYNNVFSNKNGSYALYLNSENSNMEVYHNTITSRNTPVYIRSRHVKLRFKNNFLYSENCGTVVRMRDLNNNDGYEISNNAYGTSNTSCTPFSINNQSYQSISELKSRTMLGEGSIFGNPNFASYPSDLTPQNGLFGNIGVPIPGIGVDINNTSRNATQPDAGAYEFNPTKTNDLAILSIDGFKAPNCNNNKDISVKVKNIGINSIDSFAITYWVNGTQMGTNYVQNTLAQSASADINLGSYNFDGDNDSLSINIITVDGLTDNDPSNNSQDLFGIYAPVAAGSYVFGESDTLKGLKEFADKMSLGGICGPVVIKIKNGTYRHDFDIEFKDIPGSSVMNNVTLESESGNRTDVLLRPNSVNNYGVFTLQNTNHFKIQNLTIDANGIGCEPCLYIEDRCDNLTLENLALIGDSSQCDANISVDNRIDGLNMNNCYVYGGDYSLYTYGNNADAGPINITNSQFINQEYGMEIYDHQYFRFHNNRVVSNYNDAYFGYIEDNSTVIFTNNYILMDSADGEDAVYFEDNNQGDTGEVVISNNYFGAFDNPDNVVYIETDNPVTFTNNTIVSDLSGSQYDANVEFYDYGSNSIFANNIILNNNGGTCLYVDDQDIPKSDFNNFYTSGNAVDINGNSYSLSDWQTMSGKDMNSLEVDPNMSNIKDFHVCNPMLSGAGMVIENLGADMDGDLRNNGAPSIGADEFAKAGSGDFLVTESASLCDGKATLKASPGAASYLWSTGSASQSIEVSSPGMYTVKVTGLCGASGDDSLMVDDETLEPEFVVANVFGRNVSLYNTSKGNPTTYHWDFGDGSSSAQANPSHTYPTYGVYNITLTVTNDCGTKTITKAVSFFPVSVEKIENQSIKIYPNPTKGNLNLIISGFDGRAHVKIIDLAGKQLMSKDIDLANANSSSIDIASLYQGVYILQVNWEGKTTTFRVVKE